MSVVAETLLHRAAPARRTGFDTGSSSVSSLDVAIVHDYLNQRGGAERVVLELSDMWPTAPIYTSLYRPESTFSGFRGRDVRTTVLDRLPVDRGFRALFPLYPGAFHMLGQISADVVVSSSSGWAHMTRVTGEALKVVYCHTPARWLYGYEHLARGSRRSLGELMARPSFGPIRRLDKSAALQADLYIANSDNVRRRIRRAYGLDAVVVSPPVDTERFRPTPRGDRLLAVARLLPYKHVELLVTAATRAGVGLDVVGDGPLYPLLRSIAGPTVALHGRVDDDSLVGLMQHCSAVCVPGEEDFGMVAVEAQAAGKPVIAYGRGGSLETVHEGYTGVFFRSRSVDSVITAFRAAERLDTPPEKIAERAGRFSRAAFRVRLSQVLTDALERKTGQRAEPRLSRRRRVRMGPPAVNAAGRTGQGAGRYIAAVCGRRGSPGVRTEGRRINS